MPEAHLADVIHPRRRKDGHFNSGINFSRITIMLVQKFKKAAKVEMTGMVTPMAIIALMNDVSSKLSWVNAKENT